jgi:hypothetical protein
MTPMHQKKALNFITLVGVRSTLISIFKTVGFPPPPSGQETGQVCGVLDKFSLYWTTGEVCREHLNS